MHCRRLLIAAVLVAAACGTDATPPSDGDPTVGEDEHADAGGGVSDDGVLRFGDGDASTGPPDEVPKEITAAVELPESFEPYARGRATAGDAITVTVDGELEGQLDTTVTWVEDALRDGGWSEIEQDTLVADRPIVSAEDGDREIEITVSLPEDGGEGFLRVELTWEE